MSPIVSDLFGRSIEIPNSVRCQHAASITRCNSHAESFSYAGSDSSEEKRIGHDEEVIDPATPSPEIWQESDSIDNKLRDRHQA